ncbi:hypothetical protein [Paenibacillus hamazuiensis]|uniref:hypothetical protein n=1 Tax=Paenibacillus hamazuiensis TaxID=2936508 RepID=UPI00200BB4D9|nr:hypothetical protein [Paenibacillus hamazuiensis]
MTGSPDGQTHMVEGKGDYGTRGQQFMSIPMRAIIILVLFVLLIILLAMLG